MADVAALVAEDAHALALLNHEGDCFFEVRDQTPFNPGDPHCLEAWYPLFHLYKTSLDRAHFADVKLVDVTILVQAQSPTSLRELLAEHQLSNMGASDFGSHSAVPHPQAATFLRWVYQSLLLTRQLQVARLHVESFKRVTEAQVNAMRRWCSGVGEHVAGEALNQLQQTLSEADM